MCSCWWLCLPLYELISCINTLVVKKKKNLPLTEELLLLYNIIGVLQNITSFLDVFTGGDTCFCFTYCTGVMLKTTWQGSTQARWVTAVAQIVTCFRKTRRQLNHFMFTSARQKQTLSVHPFKQVQWHVKDRQQKTTKVVKFFFLFCFKIVL